jgi:hypothetical protein
MLKLWVQKKERQSTLYANVHVLAKRDAKTGTWVNNKSFNAAFKVRYNDVRGKGGELIFGTALETLRFASSVIWSFVFKLSAVNRINVVNVLTRRAVPARNRSSIPSGGKEFSFLRTTVREQFGVHPGSCAVGMGPRSPWSRMGYESVWCRE